MDILSYILGKKAGGGGGEAVLINKNVSANGTYNASADSADGYKKVVVDVPNTYAAGDEGKVVHNGALVAQGSDTVTANDTYDTTLISSLTVNVSASGTDYLAQAMNGTLTSYESNEVTQISSSLFRGYTYLTSIKIPNCTRMKGYALAQTQIEYIVLPSIQRLGLWEPGIRAGETFDSCTKLKAADLGASLVDLNSGVFGKCSLLTTVIMRSNSVVPLGSIGVFSNTPFASGGTGGTLYVPSALIASYQAATNWNTILGYANNQIKAIEGSIYETQYADGTPIT